MSALSPDDLYHTGVVVPDVAKAAARLTEIAGYRWTSPMTIDVPMWSEGSEKLLSFHLVYSIQAPHIELVQQIPGTPWMPAPDIATHHLGYFCDDLTETGNQLEHAGFRTESYAITDGKMSLFAYYIDSEGLRIEIVERSVFPDWAGFLAANATREG